MKQMTIQLTADFEIPDDFKLTPSNYAAVTVRFGDAEGRIRNAQIHIKEDKRKVSNQGVLIEK